MNDKLSENNEFSTQENEDNSYSVDDKTNKLSHCTHLSVEKTVSICYALNKLHACLDTSQTQNFIFPYLKGNFLGFVLWEKGGDREVGSKERG